MNKFNELGLSSSIIEVLDQLGFEQPTPIQEKAIPILLTNQKVDFIGLAQTGTGKTAAFGLPLIDLIDWSEQDTKALIMAPTRELGQQTAQQLKEFSRNHSLLNIEVVYGGTSITNQIKALKKSTQVVVATPGRLLDLINRRAIRLENVEYVVLDEADEMLNMGFKEDIDKILSCIHAKHSTWLFSATMPAEIRKLIKKYMEHPYEVAVNTHEISNRDITHQYVSTKTSNKIPALRRFLDLQPDMRGVMFCRTKRETQKIADDLGNLGYGVEALHGDLSQSQRDAVMKRFKKRSMQLLIATDVAARGIDVNDLTHVLHHTLPEQLDSYTHRSGRTGRAGKKGVSVAFITPQEGRRIRELEKRIKIKFEPIAVPGLNEIKSYRIDHWANLIINTRVDEQVDKIIPQIRSRFDHLSKEDLLKRLITTQLDHLMDGGTDSTNLNETIHNSSGHKNRAGYHRYFINIGSVDGLTPGDLGHFLSDISGINRKHFGDIDMKKNCAFFFIDNNFSTGLGRHFADIQIEGRQIRVNRDENENKIKTSGDPDNRRRIKYPNGHSIRRLNRHKRVNKKSNIK